MTSPPVARVAGEPITVEDLEQRMAAIRAGPLGDRLPSPGTPEDLRVRRWVARLLVTEALVRHEAGSPLGEGWGGGEPLLRSVRRLFEAVTAGVTVPESSVQTYYEGNLDRYRCPESRGVRHLLLADEAAAQEVMARIADGEDMAELARQLSIDSGSRARGGDLGEVRRGELVGPFEEAVFGGSPGELVGPVKTEFGWHVLRVESVSPSRVTPFEAVRREIEEDLLAAARGGTFDQWLERRRRELAVVDPEFGHPGDPSLPDFVHRH
jgi:[acyl-carrier-protein] S-malonyltransferase